MTRVFKVSAPYYGLYLLWTDGTIPSWQCGLGGWIQGCWLIITLVWLLTLAELG